MACDNLTQNLGFLTDAAHLLIKTAPETSAYLMAQRDSLMFHNDIERTDMQRQHVCGACGHIMIAGQGSELKLEANKAIRRKKNAKRSKVPQSLDEKRMLAPGCRKRFTCGMCGQYTDISIPSVAPIPRRRLPKLTKPMPISASHLNKSVPVPAPEPAKVSANASSKKRAKSRKQGLQALLQQAQSSASKPQNGLGLSLSDFMLK